MAVITLDKFMPLLVVLNKFIYICTIIKAIKMTNEEKILAEFQAIADAGKAEAKIILSKYAENAKNAPKIERKRPTLLKYTVEDVTPEGYGV